MQIGALSGIADRLVAKGNVLTLEFFLKRLVIWCHEDSRSKNIIALATDGVWSKCPGYGLGGCNEAGSSTLENPEFRR